jgi:hypothetical protein
MNNYELEATTNLLLLYKTEDIKIKSNVHLNEEIKGSMDERMKEKKEKRKKREGEMVEKEEKD